MVSPSKDSLDAVLSERHAILRALLEHPHSKRDIEETLNCSRSTVDRAIRDLRDNELIQYEEGVWTPTLLGRCACHTRDSYHDHLRDLVDAASLLGHLPFNSPVRSSFFQGASIFEGELSAPDAIMTEFLDRVEKATTIRVLSPVILIGFAETFYDAVTAGDDYVLDMIIPDDVFEYVHATYPTLTEEMLNDPYVHLDRTAIPFRFGLWTADTDHVGILIFTDSGIAGMLVNDTTEALTWASEQYKRIEQDAEQITL